MSRHCCARKSVVHTLVHLHFPSDLSGTRPPCIDSIRGRERRQRTGHFKLPAAERTAVTNVGDARVATGLRAAGAGRLSPILSFAEWHVEDVQLPAERPIPRGARLPIVRASGAGHVRHRLSAVHAGLFSDRTQQVAGCDVEHKRKRACQAERRLRIRAREQFQRRRRRRRLGRGSARAGDDGLLQHEPGVIVRQTVSGQDPYPLRLRGVYHGT